MTYFSGGSWTGPVPFITRFDSASAPSRIHSGKQKHIAWAPALSPGRCRTLDYKKAAVTLALRDFKVNCSEEAGTWEDTVSIITTSDHKPECWEGHHSAELLARDGILRNLLGSTGRGGQAPPSSRSLEREDVWRCRGAEGRKHMQRARQAQITERGSCLIMVTVRC